MGKHRAPIDWGDLFSLTAKEVNKRLNQAGFLDGKPGDWNRTDKAEGHFEIDPYGPYHTTKWDGDSINEALYDEFDRIDWYCDNPSCEAYLNEQPSFEAIPYSYHTCEKCGYQSYISADNIIRF